MSVYRTMSEPCRECARREAEGPRKTWWQALGLSWRRAAAAFSFGLLGNIAVVGAKHAAWLAEQPKPAPHCYVETRYGNLGLYLFIPDEPDRLISNHDSIANALSAAKQLGCPVENR